MGHDVAKNSQLSPFDRAQDGGPANGVTAGPGLLGGRPAAGGLAPSARGVAPLMSHFAEGAPVQREENGDSVQMKEKGPAAKAQAEAQVHEAAARGVSGSGAPLPYLDQIQRSFGPDHDVSGIKAHTGSGPSEAAKAINAKGFTTGNNVVFDGAPSLHTAAHEAAHAVQQQGGVQLKGGVGETGDQYERHADAVAEKVVAGQPAGDLLSAMGPKGKGTGQAGGGKVQLLGHDLEQPLPEGAEKPAHGEERGQRRYSVEQYIDMWEKEQGRKLTDREKKTIDRGCIGITANNLSAGGNPPLNNAYSTFDAAHDAMARMNESLDALRAKPETASQAAGKHAVVFAKMFWSNQDPDQEKRKKPDDKAFRPDEHGKVDMSGYEYRAQPGYINFDYAFWDEASQSFWHANHSQPGMKVYQSTRDRFARGYMDFDRVIYCVAVAENYDPGLAAMAHAGRR